MWADDLEIVESCGFDLSLSYFDSINSISVFAATDTFAHMKGPRLTVSEKVKKGQFSEEIEPGAPRIWNEADKDKKKYEGRFGG